MSEITRLKSDAQTAWEAGRDAAADVLDNSVRLLNEMRSIYPGDVGGEMHSEVLMAAGYSELIRALKRPQDGEK